MPMPGFMELMLIFGVVFLLFGAKKLPALGGAIGESIKNFKKGIKEDESKKRLEDNDHKSDPGETKKD